MTGDEISKLLAPLTPLQKAALAILAAKEIYREDGFLDWANKWLEGTDRTLKSAMAVMQNLPNNTIVTMDDRPVGLTLPRLRHNVRAAVRYAAEAAGKVRTPGMKTEPLVRQALQSALAEDDAIDLNALAEVALKTC
jgi:hypothetical protein